MLTQTTPRSISSNGNAIYGTNSSQRLNILSLSAYKLTSKMLLVLPCCAVWSKLWVKLPRPSPTINTQLHSPPETPICTQHWVLASKPSEIGKGPKGRISEL